MFRMFVNTRACLVQRSDSTFSESSNGEHTCMCTIWCMYIYMYVCVYNIVCVCVHMYVRVC